MKNKLLPYRLILSTVLLVGCMNQAQGEQKKSTLPPFTLEKNGRDFDKISIHPNSEEWLFTECSRELNPEGDCYLLRYNTNSKQLQRYVLPDGYLYGYASFSSQGNYIVMNRTPKHDGSEEKIRQSLENGEIVMMRSDGTDFRVLSIPKGRILAPVMSKDETKVAYWRISSQRLPGGGRGWGDFDVREYDLKTRQDFIFAGPFHFVSGGNLQYVSESEIMINSYGPRIYAQSMSDYHKKFNNSEVYILTRGAVDMPNPSFTDVDHAQSPSADMAGSVYLVGVKMPGVGLAFFRKSPSGEIDLWRMPHFNALRGGGGCAKWPIYRLHLFGRGHSIR